MKRNYFICIVLVVVLCCTLCGCGLFDFYEGSNLQQRQSYTQPNVSKVNIQIPDYSAGSDATSVEKVSALAIAATYELSCEITYEYSRYVSSWGWGSGSSVTKQTLTGTSSAQGTGFVINGQGYMITNAHVINVEGADTVQDFAITSRVITASRADTNENLPCIVIAYDETLDLALLKIDAEQSSDFNYLPFLNHIDYLQAKSQSLDDITLNYGESVIAIGNAKGLGISITTGVVSAPVKYFDGGNGLVEKLILTDAPINPGNSGGPLCNMYGAVVGVNSQKIVTADVDNMGFAIPSYVVTQWLDSLVLGNYDATRTSSATHGTPLTGTVDVEYWLALTREYKSDGSNLFSSHEAN